MRSEVGSPSGNRSHRALRNSVANVLLGLSTASLTVLLPPVLIRVLAPAQFDIWVLALQISSYATLLSLGMQGAVGRYVAFYSEKNDQQSGERFASTAFAILLVSAAVVIVALIAAMPVLHSMFPLIPIGSIVEARTVLLIVGISLAIGIPMNVFNGILVGLHRNDLVTWIVGSGRILLSTILAVLALSSRSVVGLAVAYALINAIVYVILWIVGTRVAAMTISISKWDRSSLREIWGYCATSTVWSLAMVMISGVDVMIVARVDFNSIAAYSIAAGLINLLAGLLQAMFGPLLQLGAGLTARQDELSVQSLLLRSTRLATNLLGLAVATEYLMGRSFLQVWVGSQNAGRVDHLLMILIAGHSIRLIGVPYAMLLLATGRHKLILLAPIIEGLINVAVAILAGSRYGASGVATAVVVGALASQAINYFYNLPRTFGVGFDCAAFLRQSIARPMACFVPAVIIVAAGLAGSTLAQLTEIRMLVLLLTLWLVWKFSVGAREQELVMVNVRRIRSRLHSGS